MRYRNFCVILCYIQSSSSLCQRLNLFKIVLMPYRFISVVNLVTTLESKAASSFLSRLPGQRRLQRLACPLHLPSQLCLTRRKLRRWACVSSISGAGSRGSSTRPSCTLSTFVSLKHRIPRTSGRQGSPRTPHWRTGRQVYSYRLSLAQSSGRRRSYPAPQRSRASSCWPGGACESQAVSI